MIDLEEFKNNTEKERQEGRFKITIGTLAFSELIVRAITAEKAVELMADELVHECENCPLYQKVDSRGYVCTTRNGWSCVKNITDYYTEKGGRKDEV